MATPVGQAPFRVRVVHDEDSESRQFTYEIHEPSLAAFLQKVNFSFCWSLAVITSCIRKVQQEDHRYKLQEVEVYYGDPIVVLTEESDLVSVFNRHTLHVRFKERGNVIPQHEHAPIRTPPPPPTITFDVMISYW